MVNLASGCGYQLLERTLQPEYQSSLPPRVILVFVKLILIASMSVIRQDPYGTSASVLFISSRKVCAI